MYLPPNAASNSAFLETLRLMLVHETTRRRPPDGPRARLRARRAPGSRRASRSPSREAPTSFGPVSYEIDAGDDQITATVAVPSRRPPGSLKLRLRLPLSEHILAVRVNGKPRPFDRTTSTVDLSGLRGTLYVDAVLDN